MSSQINGDKHLLFTNYVRKSLLREDKGKYYGNWSPNIDQVCVFIENFYIEKKKVIKIESVGNCENNGDEILMFTHH